MGLLRDALNDIGRGADAPTSAFDKRRPNHRVYADAHRMIFRIVRRDNPAIVVREHALVIMPENYTRNPEARVTIHHTAGGHMVDIPEIDANGAVHYAISGTTGLWPLGSPRAPVAQIPDIGDLAALAFSDNPQPRADTDPKPDGMAALKAFGELISEYLRPSPGGFKRADLQMEFINPDEPVDAADPAGDSAYIIVPQNGLETSRSARSTSLWRYSFRFVAYARPYTKPGRKLLEDKKSGWWADTLGVINDLGALSFDALFAQYQLFASPLTRTVAKIGDIRRLLEGWAGGAAVFTGFHERLIREAIAEIEALTVDIEETLGVAAGDRWGPDGPTLRQLADVSRGLRRTANGIGADPSVSNQALTQSNQADRRPIPVAPEFAPGTERPAPDYPLDRARQPDRRLARDIATGALAPSNTTNFGTRLVKVRRGDLLEDFVPAGFTPAHIITLNNLRFPFIDGTRVRVGAAPAPGDPRTAFIGEDVLVPIAVGDRAQVAGGDATDAAGARDPRTTEAEYLYGVDFYVDPDTRDLELDPATGDIRLIGGTDNLFQALRNLLRLPVGALHTAPSLGSYLAEEANGKWATSLQTRLNAVAARRTLLQDTRVDRIRTLQVTTSAGVTNVVCDLDAITGRPIGRLALSV